MLLYVGPNQLIPLSGFLGSVVGIALIFWNKLVRGFFKLVSLFSSKPSVEEEPRS